MVARRERSGGDHFFFPKLMLTGKYNPAEVWSSANIILGFKMINEVSQWRTARHTAFFAPAFVSALTNIQKTVASGTLGAVSRW